MKKTLWKRFANPRIMLIISMTVFGTLGPFVRNISVSSGELALYRAVMAALLLGAFLIVTKQRIPFREMKKEIPLLLLSGIAMGFNWIPGIAFGLGAACLYATVILLNKFIRNVEGIHRTFLQFLAAILVLTPYVGVTGGVTLSALDRTGWICLLIVGLIHTGVTYCLYFSSLKELPGQEAAILSYIDPLVAVLVSVLVLGEHMTAMQVVGGVLILGFTLWNEIAPGEQTGYNAD